MKKLRRQTKTANLRNLLSVFFTTFSLCVIFIVKVYTVLIKIYTVFFGKKWVALKRAGCWVAVKRTSYYGRPLSVA